MHLLFDRADRLQAKSQVQAAPRFYCGSCNQGKRFPLAFPVLSGILRAIMERSKWLRACAWITVLIGSSALISAQKPRILPPRTPEKDTAPIIIAQAPQITPQLAKPDLEAFFDGFLPVQLERDDIAGVVVAVVKDGQVLFAKGYGYSNVKERKPVTVDATLFRPGSISKTFTWTAVMQLVEQGKIDMNRDVNDYLDFKIPATFGKPITMKDLMTHTPGFEETIKDLFVSKAADMRPLQEYLEASSSGRNFSSGHDARVLELRRDAGGLHRAARLRHAV